MKKKGLALILCMAMLVSLLASCGGGNGAAGPGEGTSGKDTSGVAGTDGSGCTEVSNAGGELVNIIWQWPSISGTTGTGFQAVEDALNEMMERDIGVHVTLEPVKVSDLANQTTLTVSSGEQLDICFELGTGIQSLISNGLILPIDEYVDAYGAAIKEKCGSRLLGCYYQGKLYAVPNTDVDGNSFGYVARKDLLDKYGITVDPGKLYTMEEIEEIFATVKAGEGDSFFCQIPSTSLNTVEAMLWGAYKEFDTLGATTASGVMMLNRSFTDLKVENLYTSEEYADYANLMYNWAQKGYISKDAAMNTEDVSVLMSSGNYLGYFRWTTPNGVFDLESTTGYDMVCLETVPAYITAPAPTVSWQIPITSVNPAKAVEALNYIYENNEAAWLLQWGLEGQDYEVLETNEDGISIKYLSEDTTKLPYYQPLGIYGSRLEWPLLVPNPIDMNKRLLDFNASIPESRKSAAIGYIFNSESVSAEGAAITAVIAQYGTSFSCGAINPKTALPEFNRALDDAGIKKVIQENQRQLSEWDGQNSK